MKLFFGIIAIIIFAGVMIFGAFLMVNHDRCPLTLMGNDCKTNINPLNYALAHIGALIELTNIIPIFSALAALAALALLLCAAGFFNSYKSRSASFKNNYFYRETGLGKIKEKLFRWTALHEKRDCLSSLAASF